MPGRAAHDLDIGAFEFVGALLAVPEIRIVGDGMHGFGRCGIGAFRHLDHRVAEALGRIAPIDLGAGLQDRDLDAGGGKPRGQQRAGHAGTHDHDIRGDIPSHRISPAAALTNSRSRRRNRRRAW